jgi:tetratricopeptide (TPR) repeat protein
MLLLGALAFLLASSVARNSDLWMHLARGRLLARGEHVFSTDSDPAAGQSWLYDLICYGLYSGFGGPGLVVGKALLVVALALLLLRLSQSGSGWWVPAFCTTLALLAMSVRLLLQPATCSYFLFTLALWLIWKRGTTAAERSSRLAPWPLFVLFVVWANVDGGFVLGLAAVALVWLGEVLDEAADAAKAPGGWRVFLVRHGISFALLAAVCLLNPAHVGAFVQPGVFGDTAASTTRHALGQVTSPFQAAYFANLGPSPAALAYFPLLGLSLLSFHVNLPRWSWQRFLPWLGLALLSVLQVRTVPFFAVVAGPVLAWNIQDFLGQARDAGRLQTPIWRRVLLAGQALTVALLVVLPVCAWPGWLQFPPFEPRRWAVETPPSLERGAAVMGDWLREGKLATTAQGLHLSPETLNAFAWFCPEENGVRDPELVSAIQGAPEAAAGWQRRMRAAGINHVIVYDLDRSRFFTTVGKLLADPQQWPLLHAEGYLVIFGWRDPGADGADPFRDWRLDLDRLAFHPAEDKKAPGQPPANEPEERPWWEAFWKPVSPWSLDQEEATLHLRHADVLRRSAPQRHAMAWEDCQLAAFLGAAGGWSFPAVLLDASLRPTLLRPRIPEPGRPLNSLPILDQLAHALRQRFAQEHDDMPPALLYLAVRAARRGLAVNPNDAQAYWVLGESYLRLLHHTRERFWGERMLELVQLRQSQASTALNQAIALKPNLTEAHLSLTRLYREMGCLDLMLEHLRTYLKLIHEVGPSPGETVERFREREAALQEEVSRLTQEVAKRYDEFTVASAGWKVSDRAFKARQDGLAGKARDLLLESDISAFGPKGMALELELLLRSGRARDVRDWIGTEQKAALGTSYHWLRIQALAALGDYTSAREECRQLSEVLAQTIIGRGPDQFREIMALLIGQRVLADQSPGTCIPDLLVQTGNRFLFRDRFMELAQALQKEADLIVIQGLLALEEGDVKEAEIAFRQALSFWKDTASAASKGGLDFSGRIIAQDCLQWLK